MAAVFASLRLRVLLCVVSGLAVAGGTALYSSHQHVEDVARDGAEAELLAVAAAFEQSLGLDGLERSHDLHAALRSFERDERLFRVALIDRPAGRAGFRVRRSTSVTFGTGADADAVASLRTGSPTFGRGGHGADSLELDYPVRPTDGTAPQAVLSLAYDVSALRASAGEHQRGLAVLLVLVTLLAGLAMAILLRRTVLQPLGELSAAARSVRAGDLHTRLNWPGAGEMGALARDFDAMTAALAATREQLEQAALTDPVTGLHNRHSLQRVLEARMPAGSADPPIRLVLADLDGFAALNDARGHAGGDEILRAAGAALRAAAGPGVPVARMGSDQFALVLGADQALERVLEQAAAALDSRVSVTACFGAATAPEDGSNAQRVLERARAALAWAKASGSGSARHYDASEPACLLPHERRAEIEAILAHPERLDIVFQPIVSLTSGRVTGYEALSRFPTLRRRPDVVFAEAHACGLGAALEALALRRALEVPDRLAGTYVSLNLSPSSLVAAEVDAILPEDLSGVVLEITEHEHVDDLPCILGRLDELRRRGARIAVDDMGAGYAGLTQVMRLEPDLIKLDRALVSGIDADPTRRGLVGALVRFAAQANTLVCAEGIETLEELECLADLDVTLGQGYGLARPGPAWPGVDRTASRACRSRLAAVMRSAQDEEGVRGGASRFERFTAELLSAETVEDLAGALALLPAALDCDDVVLRLGDGDATDGVVVDACTRDARREPLRRSPAVHAVFASGQPLQVFADDPEADPDERAHLARAGHASLLIVPIVARGVAHGVLEIYSDDQRACTRAVLTRTRLASHEIALAMGGLAGVREHAALQAVS